MSFTRLKYDLCEQKSYIKETTGQGKYKIHQPLICGACFQKNPSIILQKSGVSMNSNTPWRFYSGPVDVESDLRNLTRAASKCPTKKYLPPHPNCNIEYEKQSRKRKGQKVNCVDESLVDFPDCYFPVEHTRLNNCPPRGVGLYRFDYLHCNPQTDVVQPNMFRIQSRNLMKDAFQSCY